MSTKREKKQQQRRRAATAAAAVAAAATSDSDAVSDNGCAEPVATMTGDSDPNGQANGEARSDGLPLLLPPDAFSDDGADASDGDEERCARPVAAMLDDAAPSNGDARSGALFAAASPATPNGEAHADKLVLLAPAAASSVASDGELAAAAPSSSFSASPAWAGCAADRRCRGSIELGCESEGLYPLDLRCRCRDRKGVILTLC